MGSQKVRHDWATELNWDLMLNKRVQNLVLGCNLKNDRMILVRFQDKPVNITVIQVYAPDTTDANVAKDNWFCEDLQGLLERTPKKMSFS